MLIDFDPVKSLRNEQERGLPFEKVEVFDWSRTIIWEDTRKPYTEKRSLGLGLLENRLHVVCFSLIKNGIRVISLRKANERERKRYEKEAAYR